MTKTTNLKILSNRRQIATTWIIICVIWALLQFWLKITVSIIPVLIIGAALAVLMVLYQMLLVRLRQDGRIKRFTDYHYGDTLMYALTATVLLFLTLTFVAVCSTVITPAVVLFLIVGEIVFSLWGSRKITYFLQVYFEREMQELTAKDVLRTSWKEDSKKKIEKAGGQ